MNSENFLMAAAYLLELNNWIPDSISKDLNFSDLSAYWEMLSCWTNSIACCKFSFSRTLMIFSSGPNWYKSIESLFVNTIFSPWEWNNETFEIGSVWYIFKFAKSINLTWFQVRSNRNGDMNSIEWGLKSQCVPLKSTTSYNPIFEACEPFANNTSLPLGIILVCWLKKEYCEWNWILLGSRGEDGRSE